MMIGRMEDITWIILGLWAGAIANAIWYHYAVPRGYVEKPVGKYKHPLLIIFEHYHWATILYILGFRLNIPFLVGFATVLLLDEAIGQAHKFALGSGHEVPSALLEITIIALWILAELLAKIL
jgi:hypothetical protein